MTCVNLQTCRLAIRLSTHHKSVRKFLFCKLALTRINLRVRLARAFNHNFFHPFLQLLSHEPLVLKQGLLQLKDTLDSLKPLYQRSDDSAVSVLLSEVASSSRPQQAMASAQHTPILHGVAAVHAYISMFLHTCKASQVSCAPE